MKTLVMEVDMKPEESTLIQNRRYDTGQPRQKV